MNAPEPDPTGIERRLAAWLPAHGALDRNRMLFDSGRAAAFAEARGLAWRSATAALALVAVALAGLLVRERSRRHDLELVVESRSGRAVPDAPATHPAILLPEASPDRLAPSSYFVLTARLARGGLDLAPSAIAPDSYRPSAGPSGPQPEPLRPRSFDRVLEL
jgi:hypothetical protein